MATRVLYTIDSLRGGGAETSLAEIAPHLRARGIETTIVTLMDAEDSLVDPLRARGVDVRCVRARTWPGLTRSLRRIVQEQRPHVLHTSLTRGDICGRAAAVGLELPVVTTLVNSYYGSEHRRESRHGSWAVRAIQGLDVVTSRRTNVFHAISEYVARVMSRRLLVDPSRVMVVHRGRDGDRLGRRSPARRHAARAALGLDAHVPVVLVASRLDWQKGVDSALDAFARLRQALPAAVLLLAGGDDNGAAAIREQAAGIPGVRLLGHREDVPDLMCAADCLLFPSRWEGLGGTLLEALALELPIVASDIGPVQEVLGEIPWPRASVGDVEALTRGMHGVLSGEIPVSAVAAAGRRRFEEQFSIAGAAQGMAAVYEHAQAEFAR